MGTTAEAIDIEKVKAYLREKEKIRQQKHREEFQQTAKKLEELAHVWKKYNIKKVYLYGSLPLGGGGIEFFRDFEKLKNTLESRMHEEESLISVNGG